MSNCKTIAVCNQKGGVGKTTTTVNLGIGLAMQGKKVLLIDADPQGDLTTCLGWRDTDSLSVTLTEKLQAIISEQEQNPFDGILQHKEKVDLVPSNLSLSSLEMTLVTAMSRESVLKNYLSLVKDKYDYVLIDCMPSLGMITFNALTAADSVIIPVQAQYLPAKGMTQLLGTIAKVRKHTNADLKIDGILLTLVDGRTNLAKSTVEALRENFGSHIRIYRSMIPAAVKAAEVSSKGTSIYAYEPNSPVSKACFLLQVLCFHLRKPKLFFDCSFHSSSSSFRALEPPWIRLICIRHIIVTPIMPPSRKPIIKNRNSCIVKILSCIGVLGAAPNELLLFLPDRSKNSLLAKLTQTCRAAPYFPDIYRSLSALSGLNGSISIPCAVSWNRSGYRKSRLYFSSCSLDKLLYFSSAILERAIKKSP